MPKTARSVPAGKGGSRRAPVTKWVSGTSMRSWRPGSASAADGKPRFFEPNMRDPPPGRAYIRAAREATLLCSSGMSERDWNWERQLHGIIPPLISPLDDTGAPDADAMAALVDHVVGGGCSGLFLLGGCGPGAWPTSAQRGTGHRAAGPPAGGAVADPARREP